MFYEYLFLLAGCLALTLPLEPLLGIRVLRQPVRLALTIAPVAVLFLAWDLAGAQLTHWSYMDNRVVGARLLGLPVEEYLFLLIIPLATVLAFEAVAHELPGVRRRLKRPGPRTPRDG